MRQTIFAFGAIFYVVSSFSAFAAEQNRGVIHSTILIKTKDSECPPGYAIFHADSGAKIPPGPKVCFVKPPKPASK